MSSNPSWWQQFRDQHLSRISSGSVRRAMSNSGQPTAPATPPSQPAQSTRPSTDTFIVSDSTRPGYIIDTGMSYTGRIHATSSGASVSREDLERLLNQNNSLSRAARGYNWDEVLRQAEADQIREYNLFQSKIEDLAKRLANGNVGSEELKSVLHNYGSKRLYHYMRSPDFLSNSAKLTLVRGCLPYIARSHAQVASFTDYNKNLPSGTIVQIMPSHPDKIASGSSFGMVVGNPMVREFFNARSWDGRPEVEVGNLVLTLPFANRELCHIRMFKQSSLIKPLIRYKDELSINYRVLFDYIDRNIGLSTKEMISSGVVRFSIERGMVDVPEYQKGKFEHTRYLQTSMRIGEQVINETVSARDIAERALTATATMTLNRTPDLGRATTMTTRAIDQELYQQQLQMYQDYARRSFMLGQLQDEIGYAEMRRSEPW